jgi:hypothetical protein
MLTREEQTLAMVLGVSPGSVSFFVWVWALLLAAAVVAAPIVNYQLQLGDGSLRLGAREWRIEPRGQAQLRLPVAELEDIRFMGEKPFRAAAAPRRRLLLPRFGASGGGQHHTIGSVSALWVSPQGPRQPLTYHFRVDTLRQWFALQDYVKALQQVKGVVAEWG